MSGGVHTGEYSEERLWTSWFTHKKHLYQIFYLVIEFKFVSVVSLIDTGKIMDILSFQYSEIVLYFFSLLPNEIHLFPSYPQ